MSECFNFVIPIIWKILKKTSVGFYYHLLTSFMMYFVIFYILTERVLSQNQKPNFMQKINIIKGLTQN